MKWREDVPGLPGLRGRTGVKRAGNIAGEKSGKTKRRRLRALRGALTIEDFRWQVSVSAFFRFT